MVVVELLVKEYRELFDNMKGNMRFDSNGYQNAMELDRLEGGDHHVREYLNPQRLPMHIDVVGDARVTRYVLKRGGCDGRQPNCS